MECTLFMRLPEWLDLKLRERAERLATDRQGYVRALLVRELGADERV